MDPIPYIGREKERSEFSQLFRKKTASLVTCQGRRRIGKSRFIAECARKADHFLKFAGLAPRDGISAKDQLTAFAENLSTQTKAPKLPLPSWPDAFQLLASQIPTKGSVVVLFDEISWMGIGTPDFAGYLKAAWDENFSKHPRLILVLCGSVSSWIEKNILNSTGFVGRCSWQFMLHPLPLRDCANFWGNARNSVSTEEKLKILSITGGVPKYLEEIDAGMTAEKNIERLCFNPGGLLFNDFDQIFHDIFTRKAENFRNIVRTLVSGAKSVDQISKIMIRERGGSLSEALTELEQAGFLRKDNAFDPETGEPKPRDFLFRLSDNYLRFYLKYIEPEKSRISKGLYQRVPIEALQAWHTISGLQFENLVLYSLEDILRILGLGNISVLNAGPYFQTQTKRRKGCQIDLMICTRNSVHVVETKFRGSIPKSVVAEVKEKVVRLNLPKHLSVRTALIYNGNLSPEISASGYFNHIISADQLFQ